jgi:hypothetical protein
MGSHHSDDQQEYRSWNEQDQILHGGNRIQIEAKADGQSHRRDQRDVKKPSGECVPDPDEGGDEQESRRGDPHVKK